MRWVLIASGVAFNPPTLVAQQVRKPFNHLDDTGIRPRSEFARIASSAARYPSAFAEIRDERRDTESALSA